MPTTQHTRNLCLLGAAAQPDIHTRGNTLAGGNGARTGSLGDYNVSHINDRDRDVGYRYKDTFRKKYACFFANNKILNGR